METYEVRNKRTGAVLGRVTVSDPEEVLTILAQETGSTVEDIVHSLGKTAEEAKAAIEIAPVQNSETSNDRASSRPRIARSELPRRDIFTGQAYAVPSRAGIKENRNRK